MAYSEDKTKIDSLKKIIETVDQDTTKIKLLNQLAREFFGLDPKQALYYSQQAVELAERIGYDNEKAESYDNIARYFWMTGDYPKSLEYLKKKLSIYESQGNKPGIARTYNNIGIIYKDQSDYPLAINYLLKSLKIKEELGNKPGMAYSYNNIGNIYENQSNYPLALEYYFKSLKIEEELGNKQGMARIYSNIGILYTIQSDYPLALDYLFKSLNIYEELGDKSTAFANTILSIGNVYYNQSDYPLALDYYFKSLKIYVELGNRQKMAISYYNIGNLYAAIYEQSDSLEGIGVWAVENPAKLLDSAMYYQQQALLINKELSDEYNMISSLSGIGFILIKKGEYSRALEYYQQSALLADSIVALKKESSAHMRLAECYEKLGNHKLALEHYKQYSNLNDSVFNEEKSKDIGKLEAKAEYDKKLVLQEAEQEKQAELAEADKKRQRVIIYAVSGGLIMLVVFILFLYNRFRIIRSQKNIIEKQKEDVEKQKEEITLANEELKTYNEEILAQRDEIEAQRDEIEAQRNLALDQKDILEKQKTDIVDSINYAKKIQSAILPPPSYINELIHDNFIFYKPKDIVSGDFYWIKQVNHYNIIVAADSTGHGVPGAFMSMLGISFLNEIVQRIEGAWCRNGPIPYRWTRDRLPCVLCLYKRSPYKFKR